MRTRSKPLSPSSYVSLDDLPRRRRATRSASAQPQEPQESLSTDATAAPKTPKGRGRKKAASTRGRKSTRQLAKMAEVENEQQGVDLTGPDSGESAANAGPAGHPRQDRETFEPATNSFEQPTSVLPSVEMNDMDDAGASGNTDNCVKWGPIGPKRKFRKNKISAYDILSPSNSPSGNRVEKAVKTTPIRRTRSSYAAISRRRRTEASGRIDRTLFRLPDLLSQNETDGDASVTANPITPQTANSRTAAADTVHLTHDAPVTGNTPPAGNVPAAVNEPSADAAPSNPPASPGIVRWAFNQVSRRWTNIRDRYAGNHPAEAQTSAAQSTDAMETPARENLPSIRHTDVPASNRRVLTSPASARTMPKRTLILYPTPIDPKFKARCFERQESNQLPDQNLSSDKRKRVVSPEQSAPPERAVSPDQIPNPEGGGYGMDEKYFGFTEEEYAAEEKRLADEAARAAEEKERTEAGGPSSKKKRVDPPKPRRRLATNRSSAKFPASTPSSSQQPEPSPIEPILADAETRVASAQNPPLPNTLSQSLDKNDFSTQSIQPQPQTPSGSKFGHPSPSPDTIASDPNGQGTQIPPQTSQNLAQSPQFKNPEQQSHIHNPNAAASDSDDASPLTRARSKAEQFKPKTPSRLREAHRFSSSLTRTSVTNTSPVSHSDFAPPASDRQEPEVSFRYLEDMERTCDAVWLERQCPNGDLRQLKWPKKISLLDQIRSHGVNLTDEEVDIVNESWNDPVQRQNDLDAMRTVLATAMSKPVGAPVDFSAWNERPSDWSLCLSSS